MTATPRMTKHARRRCAEMGISTKVPKRIIRNADITHETGARGRDRARYVAKSDLYPEYVVPYFIDPVDGVAVVCTVLFATDRPYVRNGATYTTEGPQ